MSIQITQPSPTVQIHLPNGKTLTGPRGMRVGEFFKQVQDDFSAPIVAAVINNEIHELTYPINIEANCTPVTMDTADGARIYRRSLVFLMEMVFAQMFADGRLNIDHSVSSGGFYCEVKERDLLTKEEIQALESEMKKIIAEDHPFERREIPVQEAIDYFASRGYTDKLRLFKHRRK